MKAKIKRQFNTNYKGHPGISSEMPSMTVPDMNLTLKELLHNHSRGISSDVHNYDPQYFEEDIPNITDLTDLADLRNKNHAKLKELQEKAKADKAATAKKSAEQAEQLNVPAPIATPKEPLPKESSTP